MSIKIEPNTNVDGTVLYVGANITVTFPASSTRKTEKSIKITIDADGLINIPPTGDLEPTFEVPELLNAISFARDISTGIFEIKGIRLKETW